MTNDRGRILVVDDTAGTRYSTVRFLKAAGFDVVEAATGAEALRLISEKIDLVLLDVQLPDIHGFELCRRIRGREGAELLPVIHLSATYKTDTDRAEGLDAGADGYLTHPVEPVVLIATIRTVLRARRAEEDRRASERRFREIFEEAPVGIALLDQEGLLVEINPGMSAIFGQPVEELVGKSLGEFLAVKDRARFDDALALSEQWGGTLPLRRSDGTLAVVDWRITAAPKSGLRLALAVDLTVHQRFAAEREDLLTRERAARDEAERLNRQKDHFLALLGHELRNPLAAIATGVALLKTKAVAEERREWVHESIERQTTQLAGLIDELLDTSRISHGKLTLKRETIPLQSAIRSAVESCEDLIEQQEHELQLKGDDSAIFVSVDPMRLEQIITNLISNAAKYTPRGGRIRLETRSDGDWAEILVVDSGVGLSTEDLSRIFEAFAQVGNPGQGLGIGLTLVRQLVQLHGGSIQAESEGLGRGSTFRVRLPAAQREARPIEPPAASDVPRAGVRILIVDDNEAGATMLRMLLQDQGHDTRLVHTGQAALEAAKAFQPQLILLDIGLPDINGYEVADRLREAGFKSALIASLSGYSHDEAQARSRKGAFDAELIKPATARQVDELVSRLGERQPKAAMRSQE